MAMSRKAVEHFWAWSCARARGTAAATTARRRLRRNMMAGIVAKRGAKLAIVQDSKSTRSRNYPDKFVDEFDGVLLE